MDIEIYTDEMEGLQELMASEEYNTNLVAEEITPTDRIRDFAKNERVAVKITDGCFYTAVFDHYTEFPGIAVVRKNLTNRLLMVEIKNVSWRK